MVVNLGKSVTNLADRVGGKNNSPLDIVKGLASFNFLGCSRTEICYTFF